MKMRIKVVLVMVRNFLYFSDRGFDSHPLQERSQSPPLFCIVRAEKNKKVNYINQIFDQSIPNQELQEKRIN